jgi:hypothetical protein
MEGKADKTTSTGTQKRKGWMSVHATNTPPSYKCKRAKLRRNDEVDG